MMDIGSSLPRQSRAYSCGLLMGICLGFLGSLSVIHSPAKIGMRVMKEHERSAMTVASGTRNGLIATHQRMESLALDRFFVTRASWEAITTRPVPVIVVTAARLGAGVEDDMREIEYAHGLSYCTGKGLGTAVVISESDDSPWPLVERFPWDMKLYHTSTTRRGKSAKEGECLQQLSARLTAASPPLHADTFIFKASGRYQVVRDQIMLDVLADPSIDLIAKYDPEYDQVFTFWFGMRWRYFQDFHATVDLTELETVSIEILLLRYARKKELNIKFVPRLYIIANIGGSGKIQLH